MEVNNFYKLKNRKKKLNEKNYFHEICTKKVRSKMDQQQNGQRQKGPGHKVVYPSSFGQVFFIR